MGSWTHDLNFFLLNARSLSWLTHLNEISFSLKVPSSIVESVSHRRLQSRSRPLPDCRGCQYKGDLPWQYTGEFYRLKTLWKLHMWRLVYKRRTFVIHKSLSHSLPRKFHFAFLFSTCFITRPKWLDAQFTPTPSGVTFSMKNRVGCANSGGLQGFSNTVLSS